MTTPSATRALDPRLANVHPLFDPSRFDSDIDYYGAIYDSAVLATRLMNSPQGLQHDHCFYYGKNVPANAPAKHNRKKFPMNPASTLVTRRLENSTERTFGTLNNNGTVSRNVFYSKSLT